MFRLSINAFTRAFHVLKSPKRINYLTFARNHGNVGVRYRLGPNPPPKISIFFAEFLGGLFWWWVLWHCYTEFGHIIGEFDYPDPAAWTDEELGITHDPIVEEDDDDDQEDDDELKPKKRKKTMKNIEELDE